MKFAPTKVQRDHTTEKFGMWEVMQYAGTRTRTNFWVCECDCGQVGVISGSDLTSGKSKSCGCIYGKGSRNKFWSGYGEISGTLYSKIRKDALRRGIMFNVDISYLWDLFLKQKRKCALTGWDIHFAPTSSNEDDKGRTASLDRIDSDLGYIRGNLRWTHKRANMLRGCLSDGDFFEVISAIVRHQELV